VDLLKLRPNWSYRNEVWIILGSIEYLRGLLKLTVQHQLVLCLISVPHETRRSTQLVACTGHYVSFSLIRYMLSVSVNLRYFACSDFCRVTYTLLHFILITAPNECEFTKCLPYCFTKYEYKRLLHAMFRIASWQYISACCLRHSKVLSNVTIA
jgi:hypothetical protein